jgi:hypothetical protein
MLHGLADRFETPAIALEIGGQDDIAKRGDHPRAVAGMTVHAERRRDQQDAWPAPFPALSGCSQQAA